jgi:hypothetical protein
MATKKLTQQTWVEAKASYQHAVEAVQIAQEVYLEASVALDVAVVAARDAGTTWNAIGEALECSRQAAWERYHNL